MLFKRYNQIGLYNWRSVTSTTFSQQILVDRFRPVHGLVRVGFVLNPEFARPDRALKISTRCRLECWSDWVGRSFHKVRVDRLGLIIWKTVRIRWRKEEKQQKSDEIFLKNGRNPAKSRHIQWHIGHFWQDLG